MEPRLSPTARANTGDLLPILIIQNAIDGHHRRTEHWALAVITNLTQSHFRVYELKGNMDTFGFDVFDDAGELRGGVGRPGERFKSNSAWATSFSVEHSREPGSAVEPVTSSACRRVEASMASTSVVSVTDGDPNIVGAP